MSNVICQSNKDIPIEMTLGNLLFYSLSDMKIEEQELLDIFRSNQIPENYVRKISKSDAYRRASSSIKNRTIYIPDPNSGGSTSIKVKIEVDEVRNDVDKIVRIMGKKVVDESKEQVKYDPIGELIFDKKYGITTCIVTDNTPATYQIYEKLCIEVEDNYKAWSVYHTKDTIRNVVNRIITDTHPINLTPTGLCKFVPRSHTDLLYSMKEALLDMEHFCQTPGEHNFMEVIPVINTEEQSDLIRKASTADIKDTLFNFTQELKEVLVNRQTLPPRTVNSYLQRFKELKEKTDDYENLLGNYLGFLRTQLTEAVQLVKDNSEPEEEQAVYV